MTKLLIISGPTATGKTSLACRLADKFNGELISADSRQIYRGMNIGTGKDHPKNTVIHLIDIINPDESFSVAQYRLLALEKIKEICSRGKMPIIVGGTGQYIDSIINNKETFSVKPNKFLRFFLNSFSLKLLQPTLRLLDPQTFKLLNNSDRHNPHRLIRKIEIALSPNKLPVTDDRLQITDCFHLSLTAPNSFLFQKIDKRIQERLNGGLLKEIEKLLKKYKWSDPGFNTLAYKEFTPLFHAGAIHESPLFNDCVKKWQSDEHNYVRRQKTWYKKQSNICIVDISKTRRDQIINIVSKWYNEA